MGDMTTRTTDRSGAPRIGARPQGRGKQPGGPADELTWSKGHRIAFRVFSVLAALLMLAAFVLSTAVLEVVVEWLPDDILVSLFSGEGYPGGLLIHRSHGMAIGLVAWTIVPAVLVQLRRPWRRVAPMLQAVGMGLAGAIAFGLAGTLMEWISEDLVLTIPILILAVLHPRARDLVRRPGFDRDMIRWAVVGAIPWAVYALAQARLQLVNAPGDPHAGLEHWGMSFLMAAGIIICAMLGASDHDGWQLPGWTAALVSGLFGVHSLVFPGLASGLPLIAAVGAVAWGVAYAVALVRRTEAGEPVNITITNVGDTFHDVTLPELDVRVDVPAGTSVTERRRHRR